MYEEYAALSGNNRFVPSDITMQEYGSAMKSLRRHINGGLRCSDNSNVVAPIACCAIFCCIDLLLSDPHGAIRHISSGVAMLMETRDTKSRCMYSGELRELTDLHAKLDLQASVYDDNRVPLLATRLVDYGAIDLEGSSRDSFVSVAEVSESLTLLLLKTFEYLTANVNTAGTSCVAAYSKEAAKRVLQLEAAFENWEERLLSFEQTRYSEITQSPGSARALSVFRLHQRAARTLLRDKADVLYPGRASHFDIEGPDLLRWAQVVLQTGSPQTHTPIRQFSIDLGVVAPLSLLLVKTSIPAVRQQATELLCMAQKRKEGMYDGYGSFMFASKVVQDGGAGIFEHSSGGLSNSPVALEWAIAEFGSQAASGGGVAGFGQIISALSA